MSDMTFAMVIIPLILLAWCGVAYLVWSAFRATMLDADFFAPAGLAAFASFLFCGPFCLAIWYALLLRAIHLSYRRPGQ